MLRIIEIVADQSILIHLPPSTVNMLVIILFTTALYTTDDQTEASKYSVRLRHNGLRAEKNIDSGIAKACCIVCCFVIT